MVLISFLESGGVGLSNPTAVTNVHPITDMHILDELTIGLLNHTGLVHL